MGRPCDERVVLISFEEVIEIDLKCITNIFNNWSDFLWKGLLDCSFGDISTNVLFVIFLFLGLLIFVTFFYQFFLFDFNRWTKILFFQFPFRFDLFDMEIKWLKLLLKLSRRCEIMIIFLIAFTIPHFQLDLGITMFNKVHVESYGGFFW